MILPASDNPLLFGIDIHGTGRNRAYARGRSSLIIGAIAINIVVREHPKGAVNAVLGGVGYDIIDRDGRTGRIESTRIPVKGVVNDPRIVRTRNANASMAHKKDLIEEIVLDQSAFSSE